MEIMMLNSRTKEATRYNEKKSHLLTANNINSSTMSVNITVVWLTGGKILHIHLTFCMSVCVCVCSL